MPWKFTEDNQVVVQDGKPVYIYPDGNEAPFDADSTIVTIKKANKEAQERRTKLNEYEPIFTTLRDAGVEIEAKAITDFVNASKKNSEIVANYGDGELVKAGEVDKIKAQAIASTQEAYEKKMLDQNTLHKAKEDDYLQKFNTSDQIIRKLLVESEFKGSEFIREEVTMPWGFVYDRYKDNFIIEKAEGDKGHVVRAKRADGSDVLSLSKPGQLAPPDEAIEILLKEHSQADTFLRSRVSGGSGLKGSGYNYGKAIDSSQIGDDLEGVASGKTRVNLK